MTETGDESGAGPLLKNRYRLGRVLGRGGMCIVYQAWDTRLQRNVAVKRLEPPLNQDPRTRARFDREGRALAQLSHPNLVTLIDRGTSDDEDYLVFEYVEGRSLKEIVREGPMSVGDVGHIVGQVAEGLAAAHTGGIVHRDVKPQNILIDRHGHAKVSDFGIATGPDWTRVTRAGSIIGSARYMSPEQIRSKPVDGRSDIYSLGVVMFEMLTGQPPFDGANMPEIARMHLNSPPPPLGELRTNLPEGLEKVVMRCLEKMPEYRFSSMDELLGALVGLGLYAPQRVSEVASPRRRQHRRDADQEREVRRPRAAGAGVAGRGDEGAESGWAREQARVLARRRRARRRWKIIGAIVVLILAVVAAVLALTLTEGGAPYVKGLTVDQAKELAEGVGMEVEITDQVPSFTEQAGIVQAQEPLEGQKSPDNTLRLTVTRKPTKVAVESIVDHDPEGDNTENPNRLGNLVDGKDGTTWSTELYRSSSFGGLKTGVGLEFTLEEEASLIEISATVEGWKGELLQTISSGGLTKLRTLEGQANQIISLTTPIDHGRFWFTLLVPLTESRWGVELSEITFYK